MNNILSLPRLLHLMRNDIRIQSKAILTGLATFIVFFALLPFHASGEASLYFVILYIGGFIITSLAFNDLHDWRKIHLFLMLPCSNLERFLSKWLLTSVGYALGLLLIYFCFSLVSVALNTLIFKQSAALLNITNASLWLGIGKYIILQAIILLGAITFKKYALLKTGLIIGCFFLLLNIVSLLLAWMVCPTCMQSWLVIQATFKSSYFIFWLGIAPLCWYLTYRRLTHYELR